MYTPVLLYKSGVEGVKLYMDKLSWFEEESVNDETIQIKLCHWLRNFIFIMCANFENILGHFSHSQRGIGCTNVISVFSLLC